MDPKDFSNNRQDYQMSAPYKVTFNRKRQIRNKEVQEDFTELALELSDMTEANEVINRIRKL